MPLTFGAETLPTRVGRVVKGKIVSTGQNGTLFYGPYIMIAPGQYLALDFGKCILAETTITLDGGLAPPLQLPFDIPDKTANKFEVICDITGLRRIVVSGLLLSERPKAPAPKRKLLGLFR